LCVALSLIPDRDIYILDEPFEGIDFGGKIRIRELLQETLKECKSVLLVSHSITGLEEIADYLLILDEGELKFSGTPEELVRSFPKITSLRVDVNNFKNCAIFEEAIKEGFVIAQGDTISITGEKEKIKHLAEKCGLDTDRPTIGEVHAFFVSRS
jgi:ABC-2 type transport system ATP-binding protein